MTGNKKEGHSATRMRDLETGLCSESRKRGSISFKWDFDREEFEKGEKIVKGHLIQGKKLRSLASCPLCLS